MSKVVSTVERAASVRALVAARRPRSWHLGYPEVVRARVQTYASGRLAAGWTVSQIAEELGLSRYSVASWMAAPGPAARLRSVEVVPDSIAVPLAPGLGCGLVLVTPRGYRAEGLDVSAAARLPLAVG